MTYKYNFIIKEIYFINHLFLQDQYRLNMTTLSLLVQTYKHPPVHWKSSVTFSPCHRSIEQCSYQGYVCGQQLSQSLENLKQSQPQHCQIIFLTLKRPVLLSHLKEALLWLPCSSSPNKTDRQGSLWTIQI